jgi:hypothetical protein
MLTLSIPIGQWATPLRPPFAACVAVTAPQYSHKQTPEHGVLLENREGKTWQSA